MSDTSKKLGIFIETKFSGEGFERARDEQKKTEEQGKQSAQKMSAEYEAAFSSIGLAATAAFVAVGAAIGFGVKEAAQGEQANNRLRSSIRGLVTDSDSFIDRANKTAGSLQSLTGIADDEYINTLARMVAINHDAEGSLANIGLVSDFAAWKQIDVASSADIVARAMEGEMGRLGMIAPELAHHIEQLGDTATQADKTRIMLEYISQAQGKAQESAKGLTGQFNVARREFENAGEALGKIFLPPVTQAISSVAESARGIADWISKYPDLVREITTATIALGGFVAITGGLVVGIPKAVAAIKTLQLALTALVTQHPYLLAITASLTAFAWGWHEVSKETDRWKAGAGELITDINAVSQNVGDQIMVLDFVTGKWRTYSEMMLENADAQRAMEEIAKATSAIKPSDYSLHIEPIKVDEILPSPADVAAMHKGLNDVLIEGEKNRWSEFGHVQLNAEAKSLQESKEINQRRVALFRSMQNQISGIFSSTFSIITNTEMTGMEKLRQIWENFTQAILGMIGQMIARWIAFQAVRGIFGIAGIPLPVFNQGGIVQGLASGGIVGGIGYSDSVPAMLTPGERVISREVYNERRTEIESAIAGGGGNTFNVTISTDRNLSYADRLGLIQDFKEMLPRAIEEIIDNRLFRPGYNIG